MSTKENRGGPRVPGPGKKIGRPSWVSEGEQRVKVSTTLAPGSKEKAKAVADILGLLGWGYSFEVALDKMIESDQELKTKLAEMGIIVKGDTANARPFELEFVKMQGRIGMLKTLAIDSVLSIKFKKLTDEQRQLVNYLAASDLVKIVDGHVTRSFGA